MKERNVTTGLKRMMVLAQPPVLQFLAPAVPLHSKWLQYAPLSTSTFTKTNTAHEARSQKPTTKPPFPLSRTQREFLDSAVRLSLHLPATLSTQLASNPKSVAPC